jgi:polysaccharide deacetylase family protein (PEP-CTERM system associated)
MRDPPAGADILTIDFEDWFHILDPNWRDPAVWTTLPSHAVADTRRVLRLLDRHGARATFFVLGWLAERTPDIVREIAKRGHEIASHGYLHVPPDEMSERAFRDDLRRSLEVIEGLTGNRVKGFRAPGFGIRGCSFPYFEILREHGLTYDASHFPGIYPGRRPENGGATPPCPDPRLEGLWEIPISTVRLWRYPVAFSGGGFLRHLPAWFVQWCAGRVRESGRPVVFYLHPRDLNPASPRISTTSLRKFRYYGGRKGMVAKLEAILRGRRLVSIEEFLRCPLP